VEILNRTEYKFAYLPNRINFPGHSLTLIVKGTFALQPGKPTIATEEQLFPTGDELYPDDEEGLGAPRYENDFAPLKTNADLLLVGTCYPPNQTAVPFTRATFRVGQRAKTVAVIGNRFWKGRMGGWTDPAPFTEMAIRYENSYGGPGFPQNPIGKGFEEQKNEDGSKEHPLPNIEDPANLIRGKGDRRDPTGFGPLGRLWKERFSKVGSYKGDWLEKRFPAFPTDFDWRHFNAAPADLQVPGYLRGDEELFMENLHREFPAYTSQLPGKRIRCFMREAAPENVAEQPFREVVMNLDTLTVDMEAETATLLWRGLTEVKTEEFKEFDYLLVTSENLSDPRQSLEQCQSLLDQTIAEWAAQWGDGPLEEPPVDPEAAEAPTTEATETIVAPCLTREHVLHQISEAGELSQTNLKGLDLTGITAKEIDFSGADLTGVSLSGSDLSGSIFSAAILEGADLSDCILTGANFTNARLQSARLVQAKLQEADFTGARLSGADLSGATATDALFGQADLQKADLRNIDAEGAHFAGAQLKEARLDSAKLNVTNFAGAMLEGATLRNASLCNSNWAEVSGANVIFDHAELAGFRARDGCDLSHSSFREAKGKESIWQTAILVDADFSYAEMEGADFSDANLQGASLVAADMKFARFDKANLTGAKLITMNLFLGSLEKADLTNADLSGSNMYGAEFLDAKFHNTVGKGTNLKMTKQDRG
jgi:uncharacterized protein YjbI with pentapeptide repeats